MWNSTSVVWSTLCACVCVHVVVPMVSGSCCNMLEDSSRSSKASQPETSASSVSMRFLARSKYRSWRSFPIDWRAERRGETGRKEGLNGEIRGGGHVTCGALSVLSPPVWTAESCYPATVPSGCGSAPTPPANWRQTSKRTIERRGNTWFIQEQRAQVFSCNNNNKQSHDGRGGRVGGPGPSLPPLSVSWQHPANLLVSGPLPV